MQSSARILARAIEINRVFASVLWMPWRSSKNWTREEKAEQQILWGEKISVIYLLLLN